MKRDEFNRLLEDFLDGELNEEGLALLEKARREDPQLDAEADGMDWLERNLQVHLKPIRKAKAPERDHATRIVSRLRMEKETARQERDDRGVVPWFGWRLVSVAGYTFLVCLFSVLATMQFAVPKFAEQGARMLASVEQDTLKVRAEADEYYETKVAEADDIIRAARLKTDPVLSQPPIMLNTDALANASREPLFSDGEEGMTEPYYKADEEMFMSLWGIEAGEIPEDETAEDSEETE
jgi:hypothetical protein